MTVKDRYSGFQTLCEKLNKYGCHFLTLLSIAEEESGKTIDLIEAVRLSQSKKWIDGDFTVTVEGSLKLLELYTGKKWIRKEVVKLPSVIKDNEYTEAVWYNPRTNFTHYRRRGFDTLENSVTVAEGSIKKYYIYCCTK